MKNHLIRRRYMTITGAIVLLMVVAPLVKGAPIHSLVGIFLLLCICITSLRSVTRSRAAFYTGGLVALAAFTASMPRYLQLDWGQMTKPMEVVGLLLFALFWGLVISIILRQMSRDAATSLDTIFGGVAVYFLLGLMWEFFYYIALILAPASLTQGGQSLALGPNTFDLLLYFSFMTMTTVGYGDVVPASDATRILAILQAVTGQLYLVILIGGLVGAHIGAVHRTQRPEDQSPPGQKRQ
jgi:voltage-gated potassium channel Kch